VSQVQTVVNRTTLTSQNDWAYPTWRDHCASYCHFCDYFLLFCYLLTDFNRFIGSATGWRYFLYRTTKWFPTLVDRLKWLIWQVISHLFLARTSYTWLCYQ